MAEIERWAQEKLNLVDEKVKKELFRLGGDTPYIPYDGKYNDIVKDRGIDWWTNGFWSGLLWQMKNYTQDDIYGKEAIHQEDRLNEALYKFNDVHHDVGFMFLHSAVAHYRMTKNIQARQTGLHAATLLAGRFNSEGNFIVAWNNQPGWVIIDSMMNVPLLYWAYQETKDPRFLQIAKKHTDTIAKYMIREDGSVGHIGSFDAVTGEFIEQVGGQGYGSDSAWSRGNSWAIYGFALSYHHTKNPYYLDIAKRVANFFISRITETDFIPLVDLKAPKEPRVFDTSAGMCAACGLLEIANYVSVEEKDFYRNSAIKILMATEKKYANWDLEEDGIIGGGTEAYHRPSTYEVPLIYSDYFFVEALLRLVNKELFIW